MRVVFINEDFFWCSREPKNYLGVKALQRAILDFKRDRCVDSSHEHFLKHHGNYSVYSTEKELPSDLKYEGSIKELYLKLLEIPNN